MRASYTLKLFPSDGRHLVTSQSAERARANVQTAAETTDCERIIVSVRIISRWQPADCSISSAGKLRFYYQLLCPFSLSD